ncbi:hypothetical protein KFE25_004979 [Diacronema lutheri]|uniref:NAD(P)-binding domain-containing protein n=1 Tax=Diacronema lutheri TaxID=2081491 RepID=A0A8J5XG54_DIALT|nr:hypothetical protein KFE25_004979 [Diacronema lutheri]
MSRRALVVFGGNGFVGSAVCAAAVARNVPVVAVSRSGTRPPQLSGGDGCWSERVRWVKGDALDASTYEALLGEAAAVVVSVGTPPLPFVNRAFQRKMNGETNAAIVRAAGRAGVERVVLVNAAMPAWLLAVAPGYAEGKRDAAVAAAAFAADRSAVSSAAHAAVLEPSVVYGTRYTVAPWGGTVPVPLGVVLGPASWALRSLSGLTRALRRAAPYAFDGVLFPPVPVGAVARGAVHHALDAQPAGGKVVTEGPEELLRYA